MYQTYKDIDKETYELEESDWFWVLYYAHSDNKITLTEPIRQLFIKDHLVRNNVEQIMWAINYGGVTALTGFLTGPLIGDHIGGWNYRSDKELLDSMVETVEWRNLDCMYSTLKQCYSYTDLESLKDEYMNCLME